MSVSFTDDDGYPESLSSAATGTVDPPPNASPVGLPAITGTTRVGETLSADTSGISDANGLTNVSYSHQWIRNDGSSNAAISGATGQSYTLTSGDQGKTVKVKVTFTDDDGYPETLTSAATGAVEQQAGGSGTPRQAGATPQTIESATVKADSPGASQTRQDSDNTAPLLLAAIVDGTSLVLIYGELLDEGSAPATSDYTVDIGGTDYTPSTVAVQGAEVRLTLSTGASSGDSVSLDYTVGTNPVQNPTGNDAQALTNRSVTNHTGASNDRPEFANETITLSIDENSPSLTAIGDPVAAADGDTDDTLTYELHSSVVPTFFIDTSTGQVSVFGDLDFEITSSYIAPMYERDSKNPSGGDDEQWDDSIKVTINVNDLN